MSVEIIAEPVSVCFIAPKAYPLFNPDVEGAFGGAEVDLYLLATELARDEKFRVSFIVADYGQKPIEKIENVTVIRSIDFGKNVLSGVARIWRGLGRAGADICIIKTASPGVPLAALFCRVHNKNFVYRTAHHYECDGTYLRENFFSGKAFARSLRRAKIVLAQNEVDRDNLQRTIGVSSVVIPNGHRLPKLTDTKRDIILWVGRTAYFKKPELFINLAQEFPDEKFVMICQRATGDDKYDQLRSKALEVANLEFFERVPYREIDGFFHRAKALVNTSDYEGFANTFIEAGKWSVPILSLNVNPDNFLDKHICGIYCNGSEDRLAQGLRFLLEQDRYIELGRNGRKYVQGRHDIGRIVEEYKDIFRRMVRSGE